LKNYPNQSTPYFDETKILLLPKSGRKNPANLLPLPRIALNLLRVQRLRHATSPEARRCSQRCTRRSSQTLKRIHGERSKSPLLAVLSFQPKKSTLSV
jgi:hypothetical protein